MKIRLVKKGIGLVAKPAINYFFRERYRIVRQYVRFYEGLKVDEKAILYESRDGKSMTDSPYAMFKYMLDHPDFKDFKHIWSISDFKALSYVTTKYKERANVHFVKRNSKEYVRHLASSKYLINNSTFQSYFIPKKDQIYINTWHGTPLKKMGFDVPGNPAQSQNVVRNFLCTDYLISPNPHTTRMFTDSYKLNGIYEGTIIEEGYPRIDLTLQTKPELFKQELRSLGLEINEQKETILYAPTWKGKNVSKAKNDMLQIIGDCRNLEQELGNQYNILIKVHPFLYKQALAHPEIKNQLVPDFVDTNELLATVDMLITDYSSIFFDYLVTGKPIIFYTWDADVYTDERGQYLPVDMLPGPIVYNSRELVDTIKKIDVAKVSYQDRYKNMQQQFTSYENGRVTERVTKFIFGKSNANIHTIKCLSSEKRKMLIYPGGMRDNGITRSFINLMNNIDFTRYDVTCFTKAPDNDEVIKNIAKVNKNVRFLFTLGIPNYNMIEAYKDLYIHYRGAGGSLGKMLYPQKTYAREHLRLFGKNTFDSVIDFSGYSLLWSKHLIATDAKKKICFMHSDMLSDSERTVNGKKPHKMNLRGLFSIYHQFDKLVSVSKGTMEVNRRNLSKYADIDKFDYVMNSITPEEILQSKNSNEEAVESARDGGIRTEHIKAKAIIRDIEKYDLWSFIPNHSNARKDRLEPQLENQEVIIFRKYKEQINTYYKFSYNHQVMGWINSKALELLPDEVLSEKAVRKLAKLVNPENHDIWSEPYNLPGTKKGSSSLDYKGVVFEVDKEVETLQGTYSRLTIKNTEIGWIAHEALDFQCSIHAEMSMRERLNNAIKGKVIRKINHSRNKPIIHNLKSRVWEGISLDRPMFAEQSQLGNLQTEFGTELTHIVLPEPQENEIYFVNMGRLSPEKGQDNLIRAFAKVHKEFPNTKLHFLGKGPLLGKLQQLINELHLEKAVFLLGQVEDPFSFMKKCDCFILSSHYEGQPMVLLEAMTLEMKIIATDIIANRTVLEDGKYGLLVENSIDGLVEGMFSIINQENFHRTDRFDYVKYNSHAMETFYRALG